MDAAVARRNQKAFTAEGAEDAEVRKVLMCIGVGGALLLMNQVGCALLPMDCSRPRSLIPKFHSAFFAFSAFEAFWLWLSAVRDGNPPVLSGISQSSNQTEGIIYE